MASVLLPRRRLTTLGIGKLQTGSSRSSYKSTIQTNPSGRRFRSQVADAALYKDETRVLVPLQACHHYQQHALVKSAHIPYRNNYSPQSTSSICKLSPFATLSPTTMTEPIIHHLFEPTSGTWQYIVADPTTSSAVIIDPVLNFDPIRSKVSTESADAILALIDARGYQVDMILETHAHADHLTAASYLQATLTKTTGHRPIAGIGSRIKQVQDLFGKRYGVVPDEYANVFDKLWEDDEHFAIGNLSAQAIHLPGHTPDHMGYKISGEFYQFLQSRFLPFPACSQNCVEEFETNTRLPKTMCL